MDKLLYRYYLDCGRMGELEGVIVLTPDDLVNHAGKTVCFGEVLGKHSDIYDEDWVNNLELLTNDQDFINRALEFGVIPSGYNPLSYMDAY